MPDQTTPPLTDDLIRSLPAWTLVQTYHAVAHGFTDLFAAAGLMGAAGLAIGQGSVPVAAGG